MTYQKERLIDLTKRIYRITLLFPKKEPLRYKIRELADEILAQLLKPEKSQNPAIYDLEVLNSFLEVAKEQNWVSQKEILEIKNEYKNLFNNLKASNIGPTPVKKTDIGSTSEELNERQRKILEILKEKEKIQVWQLKEIFPQVSKRTLRRDFQKLWKKGIIERIGEKTNTFYRLKNNGKKEKRV